MWKGEPYYINKPGLTTQDFGTFVGEVAKYAPATKFFGRGKGVLEFLKRAGAYTVTEAINKLQEQFVTPETYAAKEYTAGELATEIPAVGVGSAVLETMAPPILKWTVMKPAAAAGRAVRDAVGGAIPSAVRDAVGGAIPSSAARFPRAVAGAAREYVSPGAAARADSPYPLTLGQQQYGAAPRSVRPDATVTEQLALEDLLRRSPSVDPGARAQIQQLDAQQMGLIERDAGELIGAIQQPAAAARVEADLSGEGDPVGGAAETAAGLVRAETSRLKAESSGLYRQVREDAAPPIMSTEGTLATLQRMRDAVMGRAPEGLAVHPDELEIEGFSALKVMLNFFEREAKRIAGTEATMLREATPSETVDLQKLWAWQKRLSRLVREGGGAPGAQNALGAMKRELDDAIYEGVHDGFMTGNTALIEQLKKATGLYRTYMGISGKGTSRDASQKSADRIFAAINAEDLNVREVVNTLFGHAQFNPHKTMQTVIKRLKKSLPQSQYDEVMGLLKVGILVKAFTPGATQKITRNAIHGNYLKIFRDQKSLIKDIFSADEIAQVAQFRKDVGPTLWAETRLNPSGTAYTFLDAAYHGGLLPNILKAVPAQMLSGLGKYAEGKTARDQAEIAVQAVTKRMTELPLLTSAAGRVAAEEEMIEAPAQVSEAVGSALSKLYGTGPRTAQTPTADSRFIKDLLESVSSEVKDRLLEQQQ